MKCCSIPWYLDPGQLPFLRSLSVTPNDLGLDLAAMSPILPQLTSLATRDWRPDTADECAPLSTSLTLISLDLDAFANLHPATRAIIRDRIEVLCIEMNVIFGRNERINAGDIISGSRVMKKVVLNGLKSHRCHKLLFDQFMEDLLPVCRKAKVELWKEHFEVGNGKVDLDP